MVEHMAERRLGWYDHISCPNVRFSCHEKFYRMVGLPCNFVRLIPYFETSAPVSQRAYDLLIG